VEKKNSGYKSFQYLEAGFDYKSYELCKELGRVEYHEIPLSKTEEERFQGIIENNIVISLHDHPTISLVDMNLALELKGMRRQFTANEALSISGLDCVFDNMMDGTAYITSYNGWKWTDIIHDIASDSVTDHQALLRARVNKITVNEAIEASDKPIYVSHSMPTRVTKQSHNTSDNVIQALAENDGLFALHDWGYEAVTEKHPVGSIEGYGECLEYLIDFMGIDHVGCGPDTMYSDQQGLYVY
jgi:hypothetical protein